MTSFVATATINHEQSIRAPLRTPNPYGPPLAESTPPAASTDSDTVQKIAASYGGWEIVTSRWIGCWIDMLLSFCCLLIPEKLLGHLLYEMTLPLWLLVAVAYYIFPEANWGRTPGKFVTRLIVVDKNGRNPSLGQVVVRTVCRIVEVNPIFLGGIPAALIVLASNRRQRLGDMWAGTYVIRATDLARYRSATGTR